MRRLAKAAAFLVLIWAPSVHSATILENVTIPDSAVVISRGHGAYATVSGSFNLPSVVVNPGDELLATVNFTTPIAHVHPPFEGDEFIWCAPPAPICPGTGLISSTAGIYDIANHSMTGVVEKISADFTFNAASDPIFNIPWQFEFRTLPEPSTWLMMISGLASVGGLLRASRRSLAG